MYHEWKPEGGPLFIWILFILNYKFLCSVHTAYSHVVSFLLSLLTNTFFTFRAVHFDVEAEQEK